MKEVRGENYYDDKVWATERIFKKVESLIPFKYGTALDLGCGQGNLSKMIHSKGYSILGVDIENFLKFDDIEFKKRDLIKNFPEIKDKVEVIYPAIPENKEIKKVRFLAFLNNFSNLFPFNFENKGKKLIAANPIIALSLDK